MWLLLLGDFDASRSTSLGASNLSLVWTADLGPRKFPPQHSVLRLQQQQLCAILASRASAHQCLRTTHFHLLHASAAPQRWAFRLLSLAKLVGVGIAMSRGVAFKTTPWLSTSLSCWEDACFSIALGYEHWHGGGCDLSSLQGILQLHARGSDEIRDITKFETKTFEWKHTTWNSQALRTSAQLQRTRQGAWDAKTPVIYHNFTLQGLRDIQLPTCVALVVRFTHLRTYCSMVHSGVEE